MAATQTQTATELSESNLDLKSKIGNLKALQISQNLTPAFINMLVKAMHAVHAKQGKVLELKDFTLFLATDPAINTYLQHENIKLNEVLDNLATDNFRGNENKDIVLMHPQLKIKILEAYNYGVLHNEPLLTPLTFIKCLIHYSIYVRSISF